MSDNLECAHRGCHCKVTVGQKFCCEACEKAETEGTTGGCGCKHSGCQ